MMTNKKMLQFVERWRNLETRRKNLDLEMSRWCADLRGEFEVGEKGDHAFFNWLETELAVTLSAAEQMLARAQASKIVPDERTWNRLGGFKGVRPVLGLPAVEQVAVLETAKVESRSIANVIKIREAKKNPTPDAPSPAPARPAPTLSDLVQLADYIATLTANVPPNIRAIAQRHARVTTVRTHTRVRRNAAVATA